MHAEPAFDRRIHRVYITRDREYHVRKGVCVAVRARSGGAFVQGHVAVGCAVLGAFSLKRGEVLERPPAVGDGLVLSTRAGRLITGRVTQIERPSRKVVEKYPPPNDSLA